MARKNAPAPEAEVATATTVEDITNSPMTVANATETVNLDPDLLMPAPELNARFAAGTFSDKQFFELKQSIFSIGVLQPILFDVPENSSMPRVRIGSRRLEAVKQLRAEHPEDERFHTIPAIPLYTGVEGATLLRANAEENLRRKDPTAMDHAVVIQRAIDAGMKQSEIAEVLGHNKSWVSKRLKLLKLTPELQAKVHAGELDADVAYELAGAKPEQQSAALVTLEEEQTEAVAEPVVEPSGKDAGKGKGKAKVKKARKKKTLTRTAVKNVKTAKTEKTAKGRKIVSDSSRSRDQVFMFFSGLSKDQKAKPAVQAVAKAVVGFMDGKVSEKVLLNRLAENCKAR